MNLAIKKIILVRPPNIGIDRKKTDNVYQLPTTAHVFSLKRKTIISQTVCTVLQLRPSLITGPASCLGTHVLTLAGERVARVLLTIST